jgi:hypothetical protein
VTDSTAVLEGVLEANRDECSCCRGRADLRQDMLAWWQPKPGFGYGPDGRLITLCEGCIVTLQFFVELPPNFNGR